MKQEPKEQLKLKIKVQFKELLRSQQGELNAVLMYQRLAKVVKTDKERETFLQLAREEGRHASVFHAYTKQALKPKATMAVIIPFLYRLLGKNRLYKMIAKGEYDAAIGYEHLITDFPEVESVKDDEKRHGEMVSALLDHDQTLSTTD
ncbi:MAG: rubrerythrin [Paludibacteraceae bacterium]|nr:rubrerythrin [Paludibacteraceae bacterium]